MDLDLRGTAVCISGGTKGMGREAALAFARERARVVVTARGAEGLSLTVTAVREAGAPDAFGFIRTSLQCPFGHIGYPCPRNRPRGNGAPGRNRTGDLALRRHSLYPLSYRGWGWPEPSDVRPRGLVEEKGIEPSTFALRTRRSPN
jgi:hypothetical protein